jgi:hypothetical protein
MYVYKNPHEQSYNAATDELAALEQERQQLTERLAWVDQRTSQLRAYVNAIAPLIQNDPGGDFAQAGLTQICRDLLARNPRWMTAPEIRLLLGGMGIDLSPYSNPMAVLHSVLRRVAHTCRAANGTLYYAPYGVVLQPVDAQAPARYRGGE